MEVILPTLGSITCTLGSISCTPPTFPSLFGVSCTPDPSHHDQAMTSGDTVPAVPAPVHRLARASESPCCALDSPSASPPVLRDGKIQDEPESLKKILPGGAGPRSAQSTASPSDLKAAALAWCRAVTSGIITSQAS